jgi:hypothetical protein
VARDDDRNWVVANGAAHGNWGSLHAAGGRHLRATIR